MRWRKWALNVANAAVPDGSYPAIHERPTGSKRVLSTRLFKAPMGGFQLPANRKLDQVKPNHETNTRKEPSTYRPVRMENSELKLL